LRPFNDGKEKMEAIKAALEGLSLSARPDLCNPMRQQRVKFGKRPNR
jgi:hypothetical protein